MRHPMHAAERAAIAPVRMFGDLLERYPVPVLLAALARAVEHRGLPDSVSHERDFSRTLPGRVALAIRQLADRVDQAQDVGRVS